MKQLCRSVNSPLLIKPTEETLEETTFNVFIVI